MKKLIFTTLAVLMISFASLASSDEGREDKCPQTTYTTYHDNGQERMVAYKNCEDMLHGTFVEYYEDGTLHGYGEFLDGEKHGKWVIFSLFDDSVIVYQYESGERVSVQKLKEEGNLVFSD